MITCDSLKEEKELLFAKNIVLHFQPDANGFSAYESHPKL